MGGQTRWTPRLHCPGCLRRPRLRRRPAPRGHKLPIRRRSWACCTLIKAGSSPVRKARPRLRFDHFARLTPSTHGQSLTLSRSPVETKRTSKSHLRPSCGRRPPSCPCTLMLRSITRPCMADRRPPPPPEVMRVLRGQVVHPTFSAPIHPSAPHSSASSSARGIRSDHSVPQVGERRVPATAAKKGVVAQARSRISRTRNNDLGQASSDRSSTGRGGARARARHQRLRSCCPRRPSISGHRPCPLRRLPRSSVPARLRLSCVTSEACNMAATTSPSGFRRRTRMT